MVTIRSPFCGYNATLYRDARYSEWTLKYDEHEVENVYNKHLNSRLKMFFYVCPNCLFEYSNGTNPYIIFSGQTNSQAAKFIYPV